MPCNLKKTVTVDLAKMNREILVAGLNAQGYEVWQFGEEIQAELQNPQSGLWTRISITPDDKFHFPKGNDWTINAIKRAYSHEVVKRTSKRFNLNLVSKNSNEYLAKRKF